MFTVRIRNEPGALARLAGQLAVAGIDIRTLACGAVGPYGCAVLSTSNDGAAGEVLRQIVVVCALRGGEHLGVAVDHELEVVDLIGLEAHLGRGAVEARRKAGARPRKARARRRLLDAAEPANPSSPARPTARPFKSST